MLKRKFFLISLLALMLIVACDRKTPFKPELPQYAQIHNGVYERIYTKTTSDSRLPEVIIRPTEVGGMVFKTEEGGEDRFEFKTDKVLKPNYPNGVVYELKVQDLRVWTEERVTVGRNVYLNGKLMKSVFIIGDQEIVRFRIDANDRTYDAFD